MNQHVSDHDIYLWRYCCFLFYFYDVFPCAKRFPPHSLFFLPRPFLEYPLRHFVIEPTFAWRGRTCYFLTLRNHFRTGSKIPRHGAPLGI